MEDKNPNGLDSEPNANGLTRRQLGVAAAWAVPVIAAVTTAPLAAASLDDDGSSLSVQSGSEISVSANQVGGAVTGTFGGNASIYNVGGDSNIVLAIATYELSGPVADSNLWYGGIELVPGGPPATITNNGQVWAVTAYANYVILTLNVPVLAPGGGTTTILNVPILSYNTTLTSVATLPPPSSKQVRASLSFTIQDSKSKTLDDNNFKTFPAVI